METIDKNLGQEKIAVSGITLDFLRTISRWANFLAIMGFISLGLMIIAGIGMIIAGMSISSSAFGSAAPQFAVMGFTYIVIAGIYIFPTIYLLKFARKIRASVENINQDDFESGIENLKSFFKFVGIFTIIIISLYILMIIVGLFAATLLR